VIPETAHVTAIREENLAIRTFVFDTSVAAEPGQFLMLWLPGAGEKPISIMAPDPLAVTVRRIEHGPFSEAMHRCAIGDPVGWRGPFGRPFTMRGTRPLLLAGGYGIAPLHFLARRFCAAGVYPTLAAGARTPEDLVLVDRFRALGCQCVLAVEQGDVGFHGYVTQAVQETLADYDSVYACGPEAMLYAAAQMCWRAGLPCEVSMERYMKCGFGICGQCAMDDKLVCKDGPVFDIEELRGSRDFGHYTRNATGRRVPL
jgi:dihydroorotate dehydrogenase electron transfer subunit